MLRIVVLLLSIVLLLTLILYFFSRVSAYSIQQTETLRKGGGMSGTGIQKLSYFLLVALVLYVAASGSL